jgi:hypothetical protein
MSTIIEEAKVEVANLHTNIEDEVPDVANETQDVFESKRVI